MRLPIWRPYRRFSTAAAVSLPWMPFWVPEVFLARFPVSVMSILASFRCAREKTSSTQGTVSCFSRKNSPPVSEVALSLSRNHLSRAIESSSRYRYVISFNEKFISISSFVRIEPQRQSRHACRDAQHNQVVAPNSTQIYKLSIVLRSWKTKTHCCGHIVADTNVSPFSRACNICCGHKFCVRDTKNVSDFVQKHFVSATNVSQFAQPKKHHGQQCVRNPAMCPRLPGPLESKNGS